MTTFLVLSVAGSWTGRGLEFELKELEIDKINENVLPILEIELISLLEKCPIIRCSFKEIIETNFMIVDHLVYPEYMQESVSAYKGLCPELQNIWSGESRETNMKLLSGISDEDPKSDKFKCFGNPPIAFPPKYHQMSVMEEGILRGKFDGENIFRWYGRTEGLIIRIDCEYGKTIKYERNGRAVAVFNDYEKSIIYPSEK